MSGFNTNQVTDMSFMVADGSKLEELNEFEGDYLQVKNKECMFLEQSIKNVMNMDLIELSNRHELDVQFKIRRMIQRKSDTRHDGEYGEL